VGPDAGGTRVFTEKEITQYGDSKTQGFYLMIPEEERSLVMKPTSFQEEKCYREY
jgi:hypothetical protein